MAKTAKRRRAASRSASGRAFVKTGEATKAMERLLKDLEAAKRGETGWSVGDRGKVAKAELFLKLALKKIECPVTQSFPKSGSHATRRRSK